MTVAPTNLVPAVVSSFVAWRVYRRVRRNIGRQPFQPKRLLGRALIFGLICVVIGIFARQQPRVLLAFGGGLVPGVLLAFVGLRLTQFEMTTEGRFYTPNTYIGVGLSLLLVGRLVYRMTMLYSSPHPLVPPTAGAMKSPLTFFMFGLLAGYYVVYFPGVFVRCRQLALQNA